jgi:hypothetical protein
MFKGHSARACVPSWGAALHIPKDRLDFVGRWRPSESAEYARTSCTIILKVQEEITRKIRGSAGADLVGEELLFAELKAYCRQRDVPAALIDEMTVLLVKGRTFGTEMGPYHIVENAPVVDFPDDEEEALGAVTLDAVERPEAGRWVVSLAGGGRTQTLHQVGRCWRVPGVHFSRFEWLEEADLEAAETKKYRRVCRDCFPKGVKLGEGNSSSSSSSSCESSDSSQQGRPVPD